jgi:hypothetical protein
MFAQHGGSRPAASPVPRWGTVACPLTSTCESTVKNAPRFSRTSARHGGEWRDLSRFVNPHRGRGLAPRAGAAAQKGGDPRPARAVRAATFVAGFEGGVSSPDRPWFRFTMPLQDRRPGAGAAVARRLRDAVAVVFNTGNVYSVLPMVWGAGAIRRGSASRFDREDVIRLYQMTAGEFWLHRQPRRRRHAAALLMYSHRQICSAGAMTRGRAKEKGRARVRQRDQDLAAARANADDAGRPTPKARSSARSTGPTLSDQRPACCLGLQAGR